MNSQQFMSQKTQKIFLRVLKFCIYLTRDKQLFCINNSKSSCHTTMVLKMKVKVVNFRKSQEISLLWLDCFITKFRNKWRGELIDPPLGQIGLKRYGSKSVLLKKWELFVVSKRCSKLFSTISFICKNTIKFVWLRTIVNAAFAISWHYKRHNFAKILVN